jgi:hypothetical protein
MVLTVLTMAVARINNDQKDIMTSIVAADGRSNNTGGAGRSFDFAALRSR